MDWTGRTVLVTGGGGFIGSRLVERLTELGATTRAFVVYEPNGSWGWLDESPLRNEIEVVAGDVRDAETVSRAARGVDTVFHLAALISIPYSYNAPLSYVRTNVEGTLNVLRAAAEAQAARVVHTSTSEVYGTARYVPIDEAHPLQGQSPYSASKIGADMLVEAFHLSFGLPVATLRPFNTYGPRQSARAVIPTIITQLLEGTDIALGSLTPTRDFTFVDDTVAAFLKIADTPAAVGRVVNVGSGTEISIGVLVERIGSLTGRRGVAVRDDARVRPPASEVERLVADATLARELLDWSPSTTLDDGLAATIEWIERNLDRYRVGSYQT